MRRFVSLDWKVLEFLNYLNDVNHYFSPWVRDQLERVKDNVSQNGVLTAFLAYSCTSLFSIIPVVSFIKENWLMNSVTN